MLLSLFQHTKPARVRGTRAARHSLVLEGLEERTVMSAAAMAHVALPPVQVAPAATPTATVSVPIQITGVNLTHLVTHAGHIVGATGTAVGTIAGHAFSTPFSISQGTPAASAAGTTVPVLHLMLAPIHLNLLGLKVDTSPICLNVDAQPGQGQLLGNLVGSIANLLNTPRAHGGGQGLLGQLNGLLNQAGTVVGSTTPASVVDLLNADVGYAFSVLGNPSVTTAHHATEILHLSVGPLNLDLLGLVVNLDNCAGGPVTVDISAQPGPGNLLGNLLSGLAGALNNPATLTSTITNDLNQIIAAL